MSILGINKESVELERIYVGDSLETYSVFSRIPSRLISDELKEMNDGLTTSDVTSEFGVISKYYDIYRYGVGIVPEGTNGDFEGSMLRFKKAANLIKREARFLFCETPDIKAIIEGKEKTKDKSINENIALCNTLIQKVIKRTMFEDKLLKGAKDCFIGKRVALVANFNYETGISLNFLKSTEFLYQTNDDNPDVLDTFIAFIVTNESSSNEAKRIFKKKFKMDYIEDEETGEEKKMCFLEEVLYDGNGSLIEIVREYAPTDLDRIPAVVILNDGLTGDTNGISEIGELMGGEKYYTKLSNGDMDAERKEMAQIRYTVDMDPNSTQNLSVRPGSYWDLQSDMNKDNKSVQVGTLSSSMNYTNSVDMTLKRIEQNMHEVLDMPYINLESMSGVITSGKGLEAVYWPLIVRTKEKMKVWGPALSYIFKLILDAATIYEDITLMYIEKPIVPMGYDVEILQNSPLPRNEESEKVLDMQEVNAQVRSKKSYMKKWQELTDNEANEELEQIAYERQLLEDSFQFDTYVKDETEVTVDDISDE